MEKREKHRRRGAYLTNVNSMQQHVEEQGLGSVLVKVMLQR